MITLISIILSYNKANYHLLKISKKISKKVRKKVRKKISKKIRKKVRKKTKYNLINLFLTIEKGITKKKSRKYL